MEEMPSPNMPVQRLKVAILPLDLPCSGPVTHSREILTSGKSRHSAAGGIMSMKNSSDTIWNRTRDLPICSAVPQPTAPPRTPVDLHIHI